MLLRASQPLKHWLWNTRTMKLLTFNWTKVTFRDPIWFIYLSTLPNVVFSTTNIMCNVCIVWLWYDRIILFEENAALNMSKERVMFKVYNQSNRVYLHFHGSTNYSLKPETTITIWMNIFKQYILDTICAFNSWTI